MSIDQDKNAGTVEADGAHVNPSTTELCVEFTGLKTPWVRSIVVDGKEEGTLGDRIPLAPGKHSVRVGSPPFGSQLLQVHLSTGQSLLLVCNRTWLPSVTISLLFVAVTSFIHADLASGFVFVAVAFLAACIAIPTGTWWLSLQQSTFHTDDPQLRVVYGGTRISRDSMPPSVYVDGRVAGTLGEGIFVTPGDHTLHVAGWTVSSKKITHSYAPGDRLVFTCRETPAAWGVLAAIVLLTIGAFGVLFWTFQHNRQELGVKIFFCALVCSAILCTVISRLLPTMEIELQKRSINRREFPRSGNCS